MLRKVSSLETGSSSCHCSRVVRLPIVEVAASATSASSKSVVPASLPSYRTAMYIKARAMSPRREAGGCQRSESVAVSAAASGCAGDVHAGDGQLSKYLLPRALFTLESDANM